MSLEYGVPVVGENGYLYCMLALVRDYLRKICIQVIRKADYPQRRIFSAVEFKMMLAEYLFGCTERQVLFQ